MFEPGVARPRPVALSPQPVAGDGILFPRRTIPA
jgi:hypothetical protein